MSGITMELDCLNICPDIGAACGLHASEVCHGLMRMWAYVFRSEQDVLDPMQVQGFMYGNEKAAHALVAFGQLEMTGGAYRVKGAATRLLAIKRSRRAGGRAAAANGNLRRGNQRAQREGGPGESAGASAGEVAPAGPQHTSQLAPSSGPALLPITNYQLPIKESDAQSASLPEVSAPDPSSTAEPKRRRRDTGETKTVANPRVSVLLQKLVDAYWDEAGEKYQPQGRDFSALAKMAKWNASDEEIVRRWRIALKREGYEHPTDIFDFHAKWNRYTDGPQKGSGRPLAGLRSDASGTPGFRVGGHASARSCAKCGALADGGETDEGWCCYPCLAEKFREKEATA